MIILLLGNFCVFTYHIIYISCLKIKRMATQHACALACGKITITLSAHQENCLDFDLCDCIAILCKRSTAPSKQESIIFSFTLPPGKESVNRSFACRRAIYLLRKNPARLTGETNRRAWIDLPSSQSNVVATKKFPRKCESSSFRSF